MINIEKDTTGREIPGQTQLALAKQGIISCLMKSIAAIEHLSPRVILEGIQRGTIVIPQNNKHTLKKPCGIGEGLRTKVNANIGTSTDKSLVSLEIKKLHAALAYGADAIMDLSVGGDLAAIRKEIIKQSSVPVGTVPIYEIAVAAQKSNHDFLDFSADDMLHVLETQAQQGVDFFTIHCGVTKESIRTLRRHRRIMDIVSRGGAIIASWMKKHRKENPFFEHFDAILDIAYRYDVTLSLGDGLRPGSVLDATDAAQLSELKTLGKLALKAKNHNVQVMIEGPGHVALDQIKKNIELEKKLCHKAPFYVLGPLVTDVAAGYDHISGAIGGALAASFGADFLCYLTPAEHLRHPSVEDVKEGVVASRIAAHAADIVKYKTKALAWDKAMSKARKNRDWKQQIKLSLDPIKANQYRNSSQPSLADVCTMCGDYCSMKMMEAC